MRRIAIVAAALAVAGCESAAFDAPQTLGGVEIPAARLSAGKRIYDDNCVVCHGERGDGEGPSSHGLWPRPRDFRLAKFKFAGIEDRGLPHDDELVRIIRGGLAGSAMQPWDLTDAQARQVIDYIKTFSREGKGFRNPKLTIKKPTLPADPYAGKSTAELAPVIAEGERIYHETFQCGKCHPSYVAAGTYDGLRGGPLHDPLAKWSENYKAVLLPTDFLRHRMRAVRASDGGYRTDDLYRAIAYGLQGPMPGSKHLGDDNIWKLVYYVKQLAEMRGTAEAAAFRRTFEQTGK